MGGTLRCDRIDLNQRKNVHSIIAALAAEVASSTCWTTLDVTGKYYFATPRRHLPSSPGWYVICDEHRRPLYAGRSDNLEKRLNSPTGSIDNFANTKRKEDPARNFIKAFRSSGVIGGLQVVFITESALCDRLGIDAPLSDLDRGNIEKLLTLFRERLLNTNAVQLHTAGAPSGAGVIVCAQDFEWVTQLCRLHRPPLVPLTWYPPSGNPDGEHLDAIVETEDHLTRIAVEVTRCYRGDRASGEAKSEEQLLDRFQTWLRDIAVACLGTRGYRITFTIYLVAPFTTLVLPLKDFLGAPQSQQAIRAAIERAVRDAEKYRHAVMIGDTDASALSEPALLHHASQVYVERIVPADPTEVGYKFEEPAPGGRQGQVQTVIPMSFWTDTQALTDAIADKRAKLLRYRELVTACGAHALWLLLVVDQSSARDVVAVLGETENAQLRAALAEPPQFEEVYLLYRGSGSPQDSHQDELNREADPTWALRRLWPNS